MNDTPAGQPATLPAAAVQDAAAAIERELMSGRAYSMSAESDEALARAALEAARPHLAAAERERLRGAYGGPCLRHRWRDCEDVVCQQIAEAVTAEREAAPPPVAIHVAGELDEATAEKFRRELAAAMAPGPARERVNELEAALRDMLAKAGRTVHRDRHGEAQWAAWQAVLDGDGRG